MKTGPPKPVAHDARSSTVSPSVTVPAASLSVPALSCPDRFGHMTHSTADGLVTGVSTRAVSSSPSRGPLQLVPLIRARARRFIGGTGAFTCSPLSRAASAGCT